MSSLEAECKELLALFGRGSTAEAHRQAKALAKRHPRDSNAWHTLGVIALQLNLIEESVRAFRMVVDLEPKNASAANNLGRALESAGRPDQAEELYRLAIALEPGCAEAHNNLGNRYQDNGDLPNAITSYQKALSNKPSLYEAANNLGNAFVKSGRVDSAILHYRKAIVSNPGYIDAHNNLGVAFLESRAFAKASEAFREALKINDRHPAALLNLGKTLRDMGDLSQACEVAKRATVSTPASEDAHNLLGSILRQQGHNQDSLRAYERALALNPKHPDTLANLGSLLRANGHHLEAKKYYLEALRHRPEFVEAANNLGNTLLELGDTTTALAYYEDALALRPNYAESHHNIAIALLRLGKTQEAIAQYKKVLHLKPSHAGALRVLTSLDEFKITPTLRAQLQEMWETSDSATEDRCQIGFALYQSQKRMGNSKAAFNYLVEANAIKSHIETYDRRLTEERLIARSAVSKQWLKYSISETPENSSPPIFIIGMPRSGTTLVEQIISSHSKVSALGEQPYVGRCIRELETQDLTIKQKVIALRSAYQRKISAHFGDLGIFTDKMPMNFQFLPMMVAAFPEAYFVHVYRDPAATCWSNFENYFRSAGLSYSNTVSDTVHFHRVYLDLMAKYSKLLSGRIYHLNYESLTSDPYDQTRKLISHLDLSFEDSVMRPHLNDRAVATNSRTQVKKPIYAGSSDRWKIFEPFLNGAFDQLENFKPPNE